MPPHDPIAAVTHPDPYPYYADLVSRTPLYRDEALGTWVATSAAAVTAVLTSEYCRVRPPSEPVPTALLDSPAGDIFRRLVRMNDGPNHCPLKRAVTATLGELDARQLAARSTACARVLSREIKDGDPASLADFAFQLPVHVVGHLLGVPEDQLRQTTVWVSDFAWCLAPASSPEQIARGAIAARALQDMFRTLLSRRQSERTTDGILDALAREVRLLGRDDTESTEAIVANSIGFLFQAYEATAGLIGNTLIALARQHTVREHLLADPGLLRGVILEVLRYDPPVQNTRRFLAQDAMVGGQEMRAGDCVLVVLAAANRDPAANPSPRQFDIHRSERRLFTFGAGAHACPGELLALTIAWAGVAEILVSNRDLAWLGEQVSYRASVNTRVPLFTRPAAAGSERGPHLDQ